MYANGKGIPEDDAEAVKWICKATEQGYAWGQDSLGVMYRNGEGVPQDDVAACAWHSVAAVSGHDDGRKNRDIIKDELTPSQLEGGRRWCVKSILGCSPPETTQQLLMKLSRQAVAIVSGSII